jgi:hypothetical protein
MTSILQFSHNDSDLERAKKLNWNFQQLLNGSLSIRVTPSPTPGGETITSFSNTVVESQVTHKIVTDKQTLSTSFEIPPAPTPEPKDIFDIVYPIGSAITCMDSTDKRLKTGIWEHMGSIAGTGSLTVIQVYQRTN